MRPCSNPISFLKIQVRISVHSSLHTQNATLGEFLSQEPSIPLSLMNPDLTSLLRTNREEIYQRIHNGLSKSSTPYDTDKLLISTVDISKSSMCPTSDISEHLLRVISQLWKVLISGTGEPGLEWANPASIIPLRIHAFATLMQLLGSASVFLSKRGMTQLDGSAKWNLISLSRVVSLMFDEGVIFGNQAEEPMCREFFATSEKAQAERLSPLKLPKHPKEKRRRHFRSNFEFFKNGSMGLSTGSENSAADDLKDTSGVANSSTADSVNSVLQNTSNQTAVPSAEISLDSSTSSEGHDQSTQPIDPSLRIDSVTDFRSALETGTREAESDDPLYEGSNKGGARAAMAMIKAYGGMSSSGSRRWMTAPAPGLATIREDSDAVDSEQKNVESFEPNNPAGPLDSLDSELFLKNSRSSVKQMRVPRLQKDSETDEDKSSGSTQKQENTGLTTSSESTPQFDETGSDHSEVSKGLELM